MRNAWKSEVLMHNQQCTAVDRVSNKTYFNQLKYILLYILHTYNESV